MKQMRIQKMVIALILAILAITAVAVSMADTPAVCVVTKGEWVWIRETPSKDGSQIDTMRYGVECQISEIVAGYAHITADYHEAGWVDVSYLEIPISETVYQVATEGPLNVRETPDGRYLRRIKSGAKVSVLGWRYSKSGELWAKVYKGGYCKAEYLAEVGQ